MGKFLNVESSLVIQGRILTSRQKRKIQSVSSGTSRGLYMICQAPEGYFGEIPQEYIDRLDEINSVLQENGYNTRGLTDIQTFEDRRVIGTSTGYILCSPQRNGVQPTLVIIDLKTFDRYLGLKEGELIEEYRLCNSEGIKEANKDILMIKTSQNRTIGITSNEIVNDACNHSESVMVINPMPYMTFLRHYIGIATAQEIDSRIQKGHEKYQYIMDDQSPIEKGSELNREIIVFPFRVTHDQHTITFSPNIEVSEDEILEYFKEKSQDEIDEIDKKFIKDSEKAFVSTFTPSYNSELFNSYPVSLDGLSSSDLRAVIYSIPEYLTFVEDLDSYHRVTSGEIEPTPKCIVVNFENEKCKLTDDPTIDFMEGLLPDK